MVQKSITERPAPPEPTVKRPTPPEPTVKRPRYSTQTLFVARVIYSETSSIGTDEEKLAICHVIQNRINNRAFGNGRLSNPYLVCSQPRAFTCVNSTKNINWRNFKPYLNNFTIQACHLAQDLTNGELSGENWMDEIVYYHDKSIEKPAKWDNRFWKAVLVKETKHFKFYKIIPNKSKAKKRGRR